MEARSRQIVMNPEDFKVILETQLKTNEAYSGENWRDVALPGWWMNCVLAEWVEFLDEVTASWKWYEKRTPKFDQSKALFEVVDTAHFMVALMQLKYTNSQLEEFYIDALDGYGAQTFQEFPRFLLDPEADYHAIMIEQLTIFLNGINKDFPRASMMAFHKLMSAAQAFLGYDQVDFFKAYKMKNERNMVRVAKGVMSGVDVKKDEMELVL